MCVYLFCLLDANSNNYFQVKEYDIWMYFYQLFVQNILFLIKPICIQVVIKHEDSGDKIVFCTSNVVTLGHCTVLIRAWENGMCILLFIYCAAYHLRAQCMPLV